MKLFIKTIAIITIFMSIFGAYSFAEDSTSTGETEQTEEVKALVLNGVDVVGKNIVELKFGSDIENSDDNDIIVRLLGDNPKEIFVNDFNIEGNSVKLILEEELESNKDYEVVIFSITAKDGASITSGLDGAIKFVSGDLSRFDEKEETSTTTETGSNVEENTNYSNEVVKNNEENTNIIDGEKQEDNEITLESAGEGNENGTNYNEENSTLNGEKIGSEGINEEGTEGVDEEGTNGVNNGGLETKNNDLNSGTDNLNDGGELNKQNNNLGGQNVNQEELDKQIEVAAGKKTELVKTGPEHILLLVLSLMLAGLVGYTFKSRKTVKISDK